MGGAASKRRSYAASWNGAQFAKACDEPPVRIHDNAIDAAPGESTNLVLNSEWKAWAVGA